MWEVDELIKSSIVFVNQLTIDSGLKRNLIWNLEQLPNKYEFDAGNYEHTELDNHQSYKKFSPFEIGLFLIQESSPTNTIIYNWVAFLLNFWVEYFPGELTVEAIIEDYFRVIKEKFKTCNFTTYVPIHKTLTIYPKSNGWFSEEQNQLIDWFNE